MAQPPDPSTLAVRATADHEAFGELFDRYYARILNYIFYRCSDIDDAEDLAARLFERLLDRLGTYNPQAGPFEPWLFAIARNLVTDHLRARAMRAWMPWEWFHLQPDPAPSPEEIALLRESERRLAEALPRLKSRQRDLLGLKYGLQLTNGQISALTGLSPGNVAVILNRAIESLRQVLADPDPGEAISGIPEARHVPK